jgi:hypothetical protein
MINSLSAYSLRSLHLNYWQATETRQFEQSLTKIDPLTGPITNVVFLQLSTIIYIICEDPTVCGRYLGAPSPT